MRQVLPIFFVSRMTFQDQRPVGRDHREGLGGIDGKGQVRRNLMDVFD